MRMSLAVLIRSWSRMELHSSAGKRPGPALFLLFQLAILTLAWQLLSQPGNHPGCASSSPAAPSSRESASSSRPAWQVTSDLNAWARAPWNFTFKPPVSQCLLHPDGTVELARGYNSSEKPAFLFDTASMPSFDKACTHCPMKFEEQKPPLCCGVCIFENRRCDTFYPGQGRSEAVAQHMLDVGYHELKAFSPCEFYQRIQGRTLWFMGDSQTWHYYYSAECFLREFAPNLQRKPPIAPEENKKLITVTWPVRVAPICLEYALGTRVCAVRVDSAAVLKDKVLPVLQQLVPNFNRDIMIFNTGLHYGTPGDGGKPLDDNDLVRHMKALTAWRQENSAALPRFIWMDALVQHFTSKDGSYYASEKPFHCVPLKAWYSGDAWVRAGGRRNIPLQPLIPQLADAHLRIWNASVPLWNTHKPNECTHWCSPSAYHMWLYIFNNLLRDSGIGNPVSVPERTPQAEAAEAAAVAAAEAAAAAGHGIGLHVYS